MKNLLIVVVTIASLAITGFAFAGDKKAAAKKASYDCDASVGDCLTAKVAAFKKQGWFGVRMAANEAGHFAITEVMDGSPAKAAGFQVGDVVLAMNGIEFSKSNKAALKAAKKGFHPGSKVAYMVSRDGGKKKIAVTLSEVPTEVLASWVGYHMLEGHAAVRVASN